MKKKIIPMVALASVLSFGAISLASCKEETPVEPVELEYKVNVVSVEGATVSTSVAKAKKGEVVTVNVTVTDADKTCFGILLNDNTEVTEVEKGKTYSFKMPESDVSVKANLEFVQKFGVMANVKGDVEGASIKVDKEVAKAGEEVVVTVENTNAEFKYSSISGLPEGFKEVEVGVKYSFAMPAHNVFLTLELSKVETFGVTVNASEGGVASVDKTAYHEGDAIKLSLTANAHFEVKSVVFNGTKVADDQLGDEISFVAAKENVIEVVFEQTEFKATVVKVLGDTASFVKSMSGIEEGVFYKVGTKQKISVRFDSSYYVPMFKLQFGGKIYAFTKNADDSKIGECEVEIPEKDFSTFVFKDTYMSLPEEGDESIVVNVDAMEGVEVVGLISGTAYKYSSYFSVNLYLFGGDNGVKVKSVTYYDGDAEVGNKAAFREMSGQVGVSSMTLTSKSLRLHFDVDVMSKKTISYVGTDGLAEGYELPLSALPGETVKLKYELKDGKNKYLSQLKVTVKGTGEVIDVTVTGMNKEFMMPNADVAVEFVLEDIPMIQFDKAVGVKEVKFYSEASRKPEVEILKAAPGKMVYGRVVLEDGYLINAVNFDGTNITSSYGSKNDFSFKMTATGKVTFDVDEGITVSVAESTGGKFLLAEGEFSTANSTKLVVKQGATLYAKVTPDTGYKFVKAVDQDGKDVKLVEPTSYSYYHNYSFAVATTAGSKALTITPVFEAYAKSTVTLEVDESLKDDVTAFSLTGSVSKASLSFNSKTSSNFYVDEEVYGGISFSKDAIENKIFSVSYVAGGKETALEFNSEQNQYTPLKNFVLKDANVTLKVTAAEKKVVGVTCVAPKEGFTFKYAADRATGEDKFLDKLPTVKAGNVLRIKVIGTVSENHKLAYKITDASDKDITESLSTSFDSTSGILTIDRLPNEDIKVVFSEAEAVFKTFTLTNDLPGYYELESASVYAGGVSVVSGKKFEVADMYITVSVYDRSTGDTPAFKLTVKIGGVEYKTVQQEEFSYEDAKMQIPAKDITGDVELVISK